MKTNAEVIPLTDRTDASVSDLQQRLQSPLTFGLLICGGIGAILFTATYLIEGATRPGYDAWTQPISALSLGPGGWMQQANFIVFGILLVVSAVGWYRVLSSGPVAIAFPVLQSISGLGLIGAGVFSEDPFPGYPQGTAPATTTVHGTLHTFFAWVIIISLALGCFGLSQQFSRVLPWRGWGIYSTMTGVMILIFWGAFVQGASGNVAWLTPITGLTERLSAMSHGLWLCLIFGKLAFQRRGKRMMP